MRAAGHKVSTASIPVLPPRLADLGLRARKEAMRLCRAFGGTQCEPQLRPRIRRKMAEAVDLSKLHGAGSVNDALERCASYGRFADGDLTSILHHRQTATVIALPQRATEERSLQTSTRNWEGFGR